MGWYEGDLITKTNFVWIRQYVKINSKDFNGEV